MLEEWLEELLAPRGLCQGTLHHFLIPCHSWQRFIVFGKVVCQLIFGLALGGRGQVTRGILVAWTRLHAEMKCVPALFTKRDSASVREWYARLRQEPHPIDPHARKALVLDCKLRAFASGLVEENAMFRAHLGVVDRQAAAPAPTNGKRPLRHGHNVARNPGGRFDSERD
jgi:hypothetical protein